MSHDIRTPMNAIIGLYNIALRKPDLDDEMRELLDNIGVNTRQLLSLINNILDMSLLESGGIMLKNEEFSFGNMLEQLNTLTESQCIDKGLTFDCSITEKIDDYYIGDDMKLKQLVFNILENAVKYTPAPGKITFSVDETGRQDGKAMIQFVIQDTGQGIDEDHLPHIFEPFSKETEDIGSHSVNKGLGLAITKNIADMMGGKIDVVSLKGKGSAFTVTIPLGICDEKDVYGHSFDPSSLRALIVDDDITACEHAKMVLGRTGIAADYVLDGEEALSMFRKPSRPLPPFNLILTDWKMPGMDGIELTRRIRSITENEDITIILTTYSWYEIMEEALLAGVDAFLAKPLFAMSIHEELGKIFAERKKTRQKTDANAELAGKRVLLAEDMEVNGQIMKQVLALKDIRTDLAMDGEEALELFGKSPEGTYDAILMDIMMPKMNGLDATRMIRKMNRSDASSIPIIALTANAFDEDIRLSLEAGMNAHLSKPVEPDALFALLKKYFSR